MKCNSQIIEKFQKKKLSIICIHCAFHQSVLSFRRLISYSNWMKPSKPWERKCARQQYHILHWTYKSFSFFSYKSECRFTLSNWESKFVFHSANKVDISLGCWLKTESAESTKELSEVWAYHIRCSKIGCQVANKQHCRIQMILKQFTDLFLFSTFQQPLIIIHLYGVILNRYMYIVNAYSNRTWCSSTIDLMQSSNEAPIVWDKVWVNWAFAKLYWNNKIEKEKESYKYWTFDCGWSWQTHENAVFTSFTGNFLIFPLFKAYTVAAVVNWLF